MPCRSNLTHFGSNKSTIKVILSSWNVTTFPNVTGKKKEKVILLNGYYKVCEHWGCCRSNLSQIYSKRFNVSVQSRKMVVVTGIYIYHKCVYSYWTVGTVLKRELEKNPRSCLGWRVHHIFTRSSTNLYCCCQSLKALVKSPNGQRIT